MTAHDLAQLPERFAVAEPVETEPEVQSPAPRVVKGSVSGKMVDPDVIGKLEPVARDLLELHTPEVGRSSRAKVSWRISR